MGHEEDRTNLFLSSLVVNKKSKGNLFSERPLFWSSGDSLIISCSRSCHLYNISTGNHVKELFQCDADIISCQIHPFQDSLLVAVSEDGEIIVFDLSENVIKSSLKLSLDSKILKQQHFPKFSNESEHGDENFDWKTQPLDSLNHRRFLYAEIKPFQNTNSKTLVWATWCLNDELHSHISVFSFNSGNLIKQINLQRNCLQKCYINFTLGTAQDSDVFVGMGFDSVQVVQFDNQSRYSYLCKKHFIGHNIKLTCLAFHPVECCFATGDVLGRIIIWRNIFDRHPLKDIFHWHAMPVHDVLFSKFGNYLFSGGEENVLVKWSLSSRSKEFLPRLSSAIHHLSTSLDGSLLSISTIDNRILIVNFNFQNVSTVQHSSRWSALKGENKHNIFTINPRNDTLVLNGKTGHLQFLSIKEEGKFLFTFDVTNRNFITSDSNCIIENTEVTHAKFSRCGKWLITAESKREGQYKESRLKFWKYCEKEASFLLNTNVEVPHEGIGIFSLEVSTDEKVATTGADKKFRLWTTFECQQGNRVREIWSVQSVGQHRNLPCFAVDFSKDATLIAVSFGPVLTIWETNTCALKCTLSVPYRKDDLKVCKFGNNELSHLVVTGSESNVSAWNTITLSMIWTVPLRLSILISDPFSIYMTAFSRNNTLIVFNPASPSPDLLLKKVSDSPVIAAHCAVNETGKFCLYFITSNQDLLCLEDADKVDAVVSDYKSNAYLTSYSVQVAQISDGSELGKSERVFVNKNNRSMVSALLEAPAHTLPNPSRLCADFLKGLLAFSDDLVFQSRVSKEEELLKVNGVSEVTTPHDEAAKNDDKLLNLVKTIFV